MSRPLAEDKTTETDLRVYWRTSPFANMSGLMRIGNLTAEQAQHWIDEFERKNAPRIAFFDALPEHNGNGGSDATNDSDASELDIPNPA